MSDKLVAVTQAASGSGSTGGSPYDTFNRSQEQLDDLAKDPDHKFEISAKSIAEREAALKVEMKGEIPGPIVRNSNPGKGDFIDANKQKWDVKGFHSERERIGYTLSEALANIERELKDNVNVILDTTYMRTEHINELYRAIVSKGWANKIVWDVNPF